MTLHEINPYYAHTKLVAQKDLVLYEEFATRLRVLIEDFFVMEAKLEVTPSCIDDIPDSLLYASDTIKPIISDAREVTEL
tara:strand:+ start:667 stop:906 length:240 start_codon:yes stop_codon:yes gene_type:complete